MEGIQMEELESEIETLQAMYDEEVNIEKTHNFIIINYITNINNNNTIKIIFQFNTNDTQSAITISIEDIGENDNNLSKKSINSIEISLNNKFKQEVENMPVYQCIDYFNNELKSQKSLFIPSKKPTKQTQSKKLKQNQTHKNKKSTKHKPTNKKINNIDFTSNICIKCNKTNQVSKLFSWSICRHSYCPQCAGNAINNALLSLNSIPKCMEKNCGEELNICDGHKISKSLLPKYQISKSTETHYRESILFYGYVRLYLFSINSELIIPKDIMELMSDYFALLSILTRIKCYGNCDGKMIIKKCDCINKSMYKIGKYIKICDDCMRNINCMNCNGHGKISKNGKKMNCIECKGKGLQMKQSNIHCMICKGKGYVICKKCKGFGSVSLKCVCNGDGYLMVLDFGKLYKRQIYIS